MLANTTSRTLFSSISNTHRRYVLEAIGENALATKEMAGMWISALSDSGSLIQELNLTSP